MTDRTELVRTLELVQPALADNNLVPVYQAFVFDGKHVTAYNDSIGIIGPSELGEEPFGANGATLLGLLKNSSGDSVDFSILTENVTIKIGRSEFKLPYFTQEEFLFEEPKEKWHLNVPLNDDFMTGLKVCLDTAGRDQAQPALMGVCLKALKGRFTLYSSDGDAITRYAPQMAADKAAPAGQYTLPNGFCDALGKLWAAAEGVKGTLSVTGEWARAKLDSGFTLYGRMVVQGEALDHEDEIKSTMKGDQDYVALPMGFDDALSRARVLADPESQKTVLTVDNGKLEMLTNTHMGVVRDSLSIRGHEDVEAHVNAAFIQRAISTCDQMAIFGNCCVFKNGDQILQLIGNM